MSGPLDDFLRQVVSDCVNGTSEGPGRILAAELREQIRNNERGSDLGEPRRYECWDCGRLVRSLMDGRCATCNSRPL